MNGRLVVLYDPDCAFCRACARWLQRLDWRRRLDLPGICGDFQLADGRRLPQSALEERLHVVTPRGRVLTGFFACRRLAPAIPILWPLAPLLYVPGVSILGVRVYDIVARHRDLLERVFRVS
jgi:predicted DCC family thiol-disulfide oxidoreductase YuxK